MATYGVASDVGGSFYALENTIIANTGWWAALRSFQDNWSIRHVLTFANNQDNPAYAPDAGAFVMYGPEMGGFWITIGPGPGPAFAADPLFFDLGAGDVRLRGGSPAIDAGDPASSIDPAGPYDVLGFGHPRLDDGDADGTEVVDIGAVEFGGLLGNGDVQAAIGTLVLELWGRPGAAYGLVLGLPGVPFDLGPKGTLFLDGGSLVLLLVGVLPPSGQATILSVPIPDSAAGLGVSFQAVQKGPGAEGLHWTNLEQSTFL